jgi:hypothetical protein
VVENLTEKLEKSGAYIAVLESRCTELSVSMADAVDKIAQLTAKQSATTEELRDLRIKLGNEVIACENYKEKSGGLQAFAEWAVGCIDAAKLAEFDVDVGAVVTDFLKKAKARANNSSSSSSNGAEAMDE